MDRGIVAWLARGGSSSFGHSSSRHNLHLFRHPKCRHLIYDVDGDQRFCLLGLAVLGSETIPDDAFVSVHPVLGPSLLVGARLLSPLASADFSNPVDRLVALTPRHLGPPIHGGRLLRRDHDPDVSSSGCGQRLIHRSRIVGTICGKLRDRALDLLEHRDPNGRIILTAVGERGGDDTPVTIDAQVQLAPAAAFVGGFVLVSLPLPVSKYLQAGRVDDQMERTIVTPGKARDLDISITPGERGVVGSLEGKAHQADQRSDEAFGLA